jgi:hypothetical protein
MRPGSEWQPRSGYLIFGVGEFPKPWVKSRRDHQGSGDPRHLQRETVTPKCRKALLCAVRFDVLFGCIFRMIVGMEVMTVGHVCVVGRFLMVAGFVMLRSFVVVVCSLRVVMGSLLVMMCCFL